MSESISAIYKHPVPDLRKKLENAVCRGLSQRDGSKPVEIFFRADDIGVPDDRFERLISLFIVRKVPINLAVVPEWLTRERWEILKNSGTPAEKDGIDNLRCWHQHGFSHRNHEPKGKKQEFGPSRSRDEITSDIENGRKKLASIMGSFFCPVFTPPWNRVSKTALEVLNEKGFSAVSRSLGAEPVSPEGLPDFQVNVDLHTRKEKDSESGLNYLLSEIEKSIAGNYCGIMIHHKRMNTNAFDFIDCLIKELKKLNQVRFTDFRMMSKPLEASWKK